MKPIAVVGAVVGGLLGAVAWGGIVALTDFEIGYMATGVGFLVGFGSAILGGRGQLNGFICAVIALLSMFGGKMAAIRFVAPSELRKVVMADPETAKHTPAEIDAVVNSAVSQINLQKMAEMAADTLEPLDIVFAVIGVLAAYRIGGSGTYRRQPSAPIYAGEPPPSNLNPTPPVQGSPEAAPQEPTPVAPGPGK